MEIDRRVSRRYESTDEDARLWQPGKGDLVRRTWDIFERFLPGSGRVLDVGGGPETHAAHLAAKGYDVTLVDPVPRHVELATKRASERSTVSFEARFGTAVGGRPLVPRELLCDRYCLGAVFRHGPAAAARCRRAVKRTAPACMPTVSGCRRPPVPAGGPGMSRRVVR